MLWLKEVIYSDTTLVNAINGNKKTRTLYGNLVFGFS
jgi:hypothetical protein